MDIVTVPNKALSLSLSLSLSRVAAARGGPGPGPLHMGIEGETQAGQYYLRNIENPRDSHPARDPVDPMSFTLNKKTRLVSFCKRTPTTSVVHAGWSCNLILSASIPQIQCSGAHRHDCSVVEFFGAVVAVRTRTTAARQHVLRAPQVVRNHGAHE